MRDIVANGRKVSSFWDSCASHTFVSTRLAAEAIANGAPWRRCQLPIKQGVINAGVSRVKILLDLTIVHHGRTLTLDREEAFVWDMGADMTLCNSLLEDENLLPASAGDSDDELLSVHVVKSGAFDAGQGENLLLAHLQARSNYSRSALIDPAALNVVSQLGPELPPHVADQPASVAEHERAIRDFASTVALQTSQARVDNWDLPKIFEIRRLLLSQLSTPDAECSRRLEEIKIRYPEAFGDKVLVPCKLNKFEIHLKSGFKYYCFLPRRCSEPVLAAMKEQIQDLLDQGVIEPCTDSPFAFPVVMARRPGSDKLRLCIDFKLQNDQTIPMPFPVPDLREQLDRLAGKRFYCKLDCSSFFHQFELVEEHRNLTAFVIPGGAKYRWRRAPFGLRNCPGHCQQAFQSLLANSGIACLQDILPYLDDVAFGDDTIDGLCEKFEAICKIAVQNGLKFKESKCVLGARAITHLGFVVNSDGLHLSPTRVDSLLKMGPAKNLDEVRHILGTFVFCRSWLGNSALMAAPLTDLLKKGKEFVWGFDQERALRLLKEASITAPCLLGFLDRTMRVYARTDASIIGVACVIFQMILDSDGVARPKPYAYASRRFSPTEFRWILNEKEAYSLKFVFETFGDILSGHDIELQTDHMNSLWLNQSQSPKVIRWRLFLNRWVYCITHLPGKSNECSDGMSRHVDQLTDGDIDDIISRLHVKNLREKAPTDEEARILTGEPDDESTDADVESAMFNSVLIPTLYELDCRSSPTVSTRVEPTAELASLNVTAGDSSKEAEEWIFADNSCFEESLASLHVTTDFKILDKLRTVHSDEAGHVGALRTYRRLRTLLLSEEVEPELWGKDLAEEATRFVRACPICQKAQTLTSPWQGGHWIRAPAFQELSIDVLEMPFSDLDGNIKSLTVIDSFSRALELFPLPAADAPRVAECLFHIYCRYGRFGVVRVDGAKAFVGSVLKLLLEMLGSRCHQIAAYAHWSNGQVERSHKEVLRHLRPLLVGDSLGPNSQRRWGTLLSGSRRIIMNTVNSSTGCTPNELVFGGFCGSEDELFIHKLPAVSDAPGFKFVSELELEQTELFARAEAHQARELERIVSSAASAAENWKPLVGDWVLAVRGGLPHGRPRDKLQFPMTGPWRVLDQGDSGSAAVRCLHAANRQVVLFGVHELTPFNSELMDCPEDYEKTAQRDFWDYSVDAIQDHRPHFVRRARGKRARAKSSYEFLILYKYLPLSTDEGSENPAWQPWSFARHLTALRDYCAKPEVLEALGDDFYVEEQDGSLDD